MLVQIYCARLIKDLRCLTNLGLRIYRDLAWPTFHEESKTCKSKKPGVGIIYQALTFVYI